MTKHNQPEIIRHYEEIFLREELPNHSPDRLKYIELRYLKNDIYDRNKKVLIPNFLSQNYAEDLLLLAWTIDK